MNMNSVPVMMLKTGVHNKVMPSRETRQRKQNYGWLTHRLGGNSVDQPSQPTQLYIKVMIK